MKNGEKIINVLALGGAGDMVARGMDGRFGRA